ncbi:MAG: adenylate/guanylate cyclase domain-containing protein [Cyclobacteriaceae bacterium]
MSVNRKKKISEKRIRQIKQVLWITLAWTIISVYQFLIGLGILLDLNSDLTLHPLIPFRASLFTGIFAGLLGGSVLVFLWEHWLRTKPYSWTIRHILISYTIIFFVISIPNGLYFQTKIHHSTIFDFLIWKSMFEVLIHPSTLIPFFFWLVIVVMTLIAFLVNDKYGPGVFRKFLMGKYFNPTREERIFMFLDLRSSTSIAETLGEEKYFNFIRDVYKEITPGILEFKGEIYQYVGDEVVISWATKTGFNDANCVNCFFEVRRLLSASGEYFQDLYGVKPEFKAGMHYGHVMAGEVGVVKRDIAFSGDVLNTTSRIQDQCNKLGVDILLSKHLVERLNKYELHFSPREIGNIDLRGKQEKVALFTI